MEKIKTTNNFKGKKLREFVDAGHDRAVNPFFAGRKEPLAKITRLDEILNITRNSKQKNPAMGYTTLIQDPPDIGKISILQTLEENCIKGLKDDTQVH